MDIYRDQILDHYHNPRNFGHIKNPQFVTKQENVSCGDTIIMQICTDGHTSGLVKDAQITDIMFFGEGCAISQASASLLTDYVKHKTVNEALRVTSDDVLSFLGVPLTPSRVKCALLPLQALNALLSTK